MELKDPHRVDVTSLQRHESFPRGAFLRLRFAAPVPN
jgi:hypothetical protein